MTTEWNAIRASLPELAVDLDSWTRRMMVWHFSDATGSEFWLEARDGLGFDPRREVRCFADLARFGPFDSERLRAAKLSDLIPRGFRGQPHRIVETGGTTGAPIRIVDFVRARYDVAIYREFLRLRGHRLAGDALAMAPSGPHAYGWFIARLLDSWGGSASFIDFDPRWVKKVADTPANGDAYIEHLLGQAEMILARNPVRFLFTTAKLLLKLCAAWDRPLAEFGVRAVCTGGTSCSPEEEHFLRENYLQGVDWIDTYGNTLMGHALQGDPRGPGAPRTYHVPPPFAVIKVVAPDDWRHEVDYGERGRVMICTLLDDLFIPNLLERDSAVRERPHPWFPWDGVSGVGPLWAFDPETAVNGVEGVY